MAFKLRDCVWVNRSSSAYSIFRFRYVSSSEVRQVLHSLKRKKSIGGILPSILKDCSSVICEPLTFLINLSMKTGTYPTVWKISKIIPFHKFVSRSEIDQFL